MKTLFKSLVTLVAVFALTAPAFAKRPEKYDKKFSICDNECCPIMNGEWIICSNLNFLGFESIEGEEGEEALVGYEIGMVCEIARRLSQKCCRQITPTIIRKPFSELILSLQSGECDSIIAGINRTSVRLQKICMVPWGSSTGAFKCFALLYDKNNAKVKDVLDGNETCGTADLLTALQTQGIEVTICAQQGTTHEDYASALKLPGAPQAIIPCPENSTTFTKLLYSNKDTNGIPYTLDSGIAAVANGDCDVFMADPGTTVGGDIVTAQTFVTCAATRPQPYAIGINKNCCEFAEAVQSIVLELDKSGFSQKLWELFVTPVTGLAFKSISRLSVAPCTDGFRPCDNVPTPTLRCSNPLAKVCKDPCDKPCKRA